MKTARTTRLLLVLLALSAATCVIAASRAASLRESALAAQEDLRDVRQGLAELSTGRVTSAASGAVDVNRMVREACTHAGAIDALAGIEPGRPDDAGQIPVIVGFTPLSLQELVTFMDTLNTGPPPARTESIELSAADPSAGVERWTATVTISVRSSR